MTQIEGNVITQGCWIVCKVSGEDGIRKLLLKFNSITFEHYKIAMNALKWNKIKHVCITS